MNVDWKTTQVTSEHFERVRFKGYGKLVLKGNILDEILRHTEVI